MGQLRDGFHVRQHPLHQLGHRLQFAELALHLVGVLGAAGLRERQTDEVVGGDLREERLGRRDADLRARAGVEHRVALARDLAAVGVADRQHLGLLLLGVPHGFQRVGGLAGLRDRDHERAAVQHGVAVAELAGQLGLDGQPGPVLDGVLGQQPGVIRGAARDDEHLVDLAQFLVGQALLVEHDAAAGEAARAGCRRRRAGCSAISLNMKYS